MPFSTDLPSSRTSSFFVCFCRLTLMLDPPASLWVVWESSVGRGMFDAGLFWNAGTVPRWFPARLGVPLMVPADEAMAAVVSVLYGTYLAGPGEPTVTGRREVKCIGGEVVESVCSERPRPKGVVLSLTMVERATDQICRVNAGPGG